MAAALLLAARLHTPGESLILCPFRWLTSMPCPFCGITRGLCALARGDWGVALTLHPLSPLAFAALLAVTLGWKMPSRAAAVLAAVFFSFGIVRIAILTL